MIRPVSLFVWSQKEEEKSLASEGVIGREQRKAGVGVQILLTAEKVRLKINSNCFE
jgi:hypothetical protein